jgi:hypothetical protein
MRMKAIEGYGFMMGIAGVATIFVGFAGVIDAFAALIIGFLLLIIGLGVVYSGS